MAISSSQGGTDVAALLQTSADRYISLGDLLKYNKPDNRDLLIQTYGDQGITGMLELTGAVKSAGTSDEVQYWEEGRLHKTVAVAAAGVTNGVVTVAADGTGAVRNNDVLLFSDGVRAVVTASDTSSTTFTTIPLDGDAITTFDLAGPTTAVIIGNIYAQGTDQPTSFYNTDVTKRINPFMITKETYSVNGSQATNIGWIDANGNGDYRWYVKGEMDTRKRFMNQREMMMLFSEMHPDTATVDDDTIALAGSTNITGSEGYFSAVESRGITATGDFDSMNDLDNIILLLDKQGAPAEYAMYVNTQTSLNMDDMVANGIAQNVTGGLASQFGAFSNSADMAVQLGFKSFTRGGYTFHKHDWKLLNDPTLLGAFDTPLFKGAMVPMSKVADAKSGVKSPSLEMNYKGAKGYSRELEHWVTGGGVLGHNNNSEDTAKFHYRSECNLITRAANQHVVLKS
tara:strand:- start:359 stop:1726 length:1368 start_codon:yes stop_codon:yes gene_type:complete